MLKKYYFLFIAAGLIIILVFIFYKFDQFNPETNVSVLDQAWRFSITKDISRALKQYDYAVDFYSPDKDYLLWRKDGYLVSMVNADSISVFYNITDQNIDNGDTVKIYNLTPLGEIYKKIVKIFDDHGYALDLFNSTKLGDFDYIQSYEKDGQYCSIILSEQIFLSGQNNNDTIGMDIKCAAGLESSFAEQKLYLDALNFKDSEIAITSINKKDNFISLGTGSIDVGGANYILKYDQEKYTIIDGPLNEAPQCEKMLKWQVPQEIYGDCYYYH